MPAVENQRRLVESARPDELTALPSKDLPSDPILEQLAPGAVRSCATAVFERALCLVDGSTECLETAKQADSLLAPGGAMTLLSIVDGGAESNSSEMTWSRYLAEQALRRGKTVLAHRPELDLRLAVGETSAILLRATENADATLLALSGYEAGRARGPLAGELVARMLMRAPSSLLVARQPNWQVWPPGSIAVGVNGSPSAFCALAAARDIARRVGAVVRPIAALGGGSVKLAELEAAVPDLVVDYRRPARALCDAALEADLVVVGQGADRYLSAPSTIVALAAVSSVLVVRGRSPFHGAQGARESAELPLTLVQAA